MFRRQKKTNEQNDLNPDNEIRKEQEAEEALLNIGNEAAGRMGGFLNPVSNEANNSIDGSDDTLKHYAENDLNNYTLFTGRKHRKKNIPPEIIKEGLTDYYENDLNNLTLNKPKGNNINIRQLGSLLLQENHRQDRRHFCDDREIDLGSFQARSRYLPGDIQPSARKQPLPKAGRPGCHPRMGRQKI